MELMHHLIYCSYPVPEASQVLHPLWCLHCVVVFLSSSALQQSAVSRAKLAWHSCLDLVGHCLLNLANMCRCALEKDPARRPDAELMLHHPWVLHHLAMKRRGVKCEPTPLRSLLCAEERRLLQSGTVVDQTGMRPQPREEWGACSSGHGKSSQQTDVLHRESQALRDGVEAEQRKIKEEHTLANEAHEAHFKQAEAEFKQRRRNLVVANERERAKSASASKRRRHLNKQSLEAGRRQWEAGTVTAGTEVWRDCSREPLKVLQWGHRRWEIATPTISFQGQVAESFAGW
jgi:hypothetical protein